VTSSPVNGAAPLAAGDVDTFFLKALEDVANMGGAAIRDAIDAPRAVGEMHDKLAGVVQVNLLNGITRQPAGHHFQKIVQEAFLQRIPSFPVDMRVKQQPAPAGSSTESQVIFNDATSDATDSAYASV